MQSYIYWIVLAFSSWLRLASIVSFLVFTIISYETPILNQLIINIHGVNPCHQTDTFFSKYSLTITNKTNYHSHSRICMISSLYILQSRTSLPLTLTISSSSRMAENTIFINRSIMINLILRATIFLTESTLAYCKKRKLLTFGLVVLNSSSKLLQKFNIYKNALKDFPTMIIRVLITIRF